MGLREIFGDVVAVEPWRALLVVRPGCSKKRAQNLCAEILGNPLKCAEFPFPVVVLGGRRLVRVADVQRTVDDLAVVAGPIDAIRPPVAMSPRRGPGRPRKVEVRP